MIENEKLNTETQAPEALPVDTEVETEVGKEEPYKSGIVQCIDSREVAAMVGKDHRKLLRDIRRYRSDIEKINQEEAENQIASSDFFMESHYADSKGETRPNYLVTKKGCEFIAHKLTGIKGTKFTATYINRFHDMEDALANGAAVPPETMEKIMDFVEQSARANRLQGEFNRAVIDRLDKLEELVRGNDRRDSAPVTGESPFGTTSAEKERERVRKLDKLVTRLAELRHMEKNKVLHYLYVAVEDKTGVSLDSYRSVYRAETGKENVGMLHVIAGVDWIYDKAVELCDDAIELYSLFI
jgi:Rha family phage regulatory protein